ncbi:protein AMEIOTIC 1 homolog [Phragmites australis]|uniref:protein AMEIOTIC 1 homolog n=1 Tax=Phragmites australis TaxID=29695 RepID=UPI002D794A27|nr:protein AMEIOTIC 1 homolog [Phragmites australis]
MSGGIPAARVLRRRVAGEDMGDDGDAFWAGAPRLYDFSQQQQEQSPRPPSPPAARRSPPPEPKPTPCGPCLLTLQGSCAGWGVRKHIQYSRRRRAVCGAPPQAVVEEMKRRAAVQCGDGDKDEERSSGAKKRKRLEEMGKDEAAAVETSQKDNRVVVRTEKTRSRKRTRSGRGRDAARRAKKVPRVLKGEDEEWNGGRKRKRPKEEAAAPAAEESSPEMLEVVKMEKTRSGHRRRRDAAKREEESKTAAPAPKPGSPRGKVDRWSARRYAAAEVALLDILRARGAREGKPLQRGELRAEARRHIGDTGLLDHLLRHVTDKVPAGSTERLRRRYNADGTLEYWLEPAGLAAVRREAGVDDPYWVPPPGWKPGDPVSPEACALEVKKKVEELAGELAVVKRHMKELSSNLIQVSKEAYISWQGYDCMMKANENLEKEVLSLEEKYDNATQANGELREELLFLKEKCESMVEKNAKLEEQMVAISTCFQFLQEDLLLQNPGGGEQHMLLLEQADLCVKEPSKADIDKQEASTGNALGHAAAGASNATASSNGGDGVRGSEKRTSRKCSVRICKPQGTFQWLNTAVDTVNGEACSPSALPEPLTPGGDLVVANFDAVMYNLAPPSVEEYLAVGGLPTPTSASSTNAASAKLPLLPAPASAVQVQPPPLPSSTVAWDDDLQAVQPYFGGLDLQLRHTDSSSSSVPCLPEAGKKALMLDAGSGNVGTELALSMATRSY